MYGNRGKELENLLDWQHGIYRARQDVVVDRCPTPMKMIRRSGPYWLCVPERAAQPDYLVGHAGHSWRADAKQATGMTWELKNLHEHQAAAFDQWVACGRGNHHAGVILGFDWPRGGIWWLSWEHGLGTMWHRWHNGDAARGEASLNLLRLRQLGRFCDGPDWLTQATNLLVFGAKPL